MELRLRVRRLLSIGAAIGCAAGCSPSADRAAALDGAGAAVAPRDAPAAPPSGAGSGGSGGGSGGGSVGGSAGPVAGASDAGPATDGPTGAGGVDGAAERAAGGVGSPVLPDAAAGAAGASVGGGRASADAAPGAVADAADAPDAATDSAGPSPSSCAGLFCEDFEQGVIDPAIWDVQVNGGQAAAALVTQPGLVAHGKYAAHFHANPNVVSYDFIITKKPPAALAGHHFGRAYFLVTPMPPPNHTELIYAGTTGFPRYQYLEVASVATSTWQLTYVDEVPPATGEDYHSGGKIPLGRWFCLEWEFSDAPDRAVVYVDGVQSFAQDAFSYGGVMTGLVGGFAAFGFGYDAWHPATYPFDLYYDDIVLDIQRVGCLE